MNEHSISFVPKDIINSTEFPQSRSIEYYFGQLAQKVHKKAGFQRSKAANVGEYWHGLEMLISHLCKPNATILENKCAHAM